MPKMPIRCRYCNKKITNIIEHRLICEAEHTIWKNPTKYKGRHKLRLKIMKGKIKTKDLNSSGGCK